MQNASNPQETGVFPRFYIKEVQNKLKSEQAGRPIFIEKEYVQINIAGDNKSEVHKKVTEEHKHRWPEQYNAFKRGQEQPLVGTPLQEWPLMTTSKCAELKAINIHTVESLAKLPDTGIKRLGMGGRLLVAQAKAYIEQAKDESSIQAIVTENEKLKNDNAMLKQQMKELSDSVDLMRSEMSTQQVAPTPQPTTKIQQPKPEQVEEEKEIPSHIKDMDLKERTKTVLLEAGIETSEQLLKLTPDQLTALPGVGTGTLAELATLYR